MIPAGFLDDLRALLEIPSVAAWPETGAMQAAANWLRDRLARAGLEARLLSGPGKAPPYVYAAGPQSNDRPTLLIYGHYDVQPARRGDGWSSDPFRPELRDGRLYARGATDQKMNLLLPVFALEALGEQAAFNIKFLFEGEEEILSPNLSAALESFAGLLSADAVISSDGWQATADQGDLRLGLRGFCGLEVELRGAAHDLHSGVFGGGVPNPAMALSRMLGDLVDDEGVPRIAALRGAKPHEDEIARAMEDFDSAAWARRAGVAVAPPDAPVRTGLLPTIELHAIETGGFDEGLRTIVPARARARLSCRLVPGQTPEAVLDALEAGLRARTPAGMTLRLSPLPGRAHPYRIAADHPLQQAAWHALLSVDGRAPRFSYSGGSIPLLGEIERRLGLKTVIFGFGLPDENMHGINEFCRLTDIERGLACWQIMLSTPGKFAR